MYTLKLKSLACLLAFAVSAMIYDQVIPEASEADSASEQPALAEATQIPHQGADWF